MYDVSFQYLIMTNDEQPHLLIHEFLPKNIVVQ